MADDAWTDKLSDYLDDELPSDERRAVDRHLATCANCARTLDELRRVVQQAQALSPRPPAADLWDGIAGRLDERRSAEIVSFGAPKARRVALTLPQLAAAAALVAAVSGALSVKFLGRPAPVTRVDGNAMVAAPHSARAALSAPSESGPDPVTISYADAQYDAAVADLERALEVGRRGKLDASTIAALEQSLQAIDQAIDQARQAIAADPANSYLSGHLVEARRRKLDLLRRATALTNEMN